MAKKKRKYYSGKELLYRRQLERQQAEAEEKTNNIRVRQLHQINASSRAIGRARTMIAFLIEVVKALVTFFAVCVGLGILYLVFVVVREVGWEVRRQNSEKHEQEDKEE